MIKMNAQTFEQILIDVHKSIFDDFYDMYIVEFIEQRDYDYNDDDSYSFDDIDDFSNVIREFIKYIAQYNFTIKQNDYSQQWFINCVLHIQSNM